MFQKTSYMLNSIFSILRQIYFSTSHSALLSKQNCSYRCIQTISIQMYTDNIYTDVYRQYLYSYIQTISIQMYTDNIYTDVYRQYLYRCIQTISIQPHIHSIMVFFLNSLWLPDRGEWPEEQNLKQNKCLLGWKAINLWINIIFTLWGVGYEESTWEKS